MLVYPVVVALHRCDITWYVTNGDPNQERNSLSDPVTSPQKNKNLLPLTILIKSSELPYLKRHRSGYSLLDALSLLNSPNAHFLSTNIQCCGSRMFIPNPRSKFFHPGSRIQIFYIPDPHKRIYAF